MSATSFHPFLNPAPSTFASTSPVHPSDRKFHLTRPRSSRSQPNRTPDRDRSGLAPHILRYLLLSPTIRIICNDRTCTTIKFTIRLLRVFKDRSSASWKPTLVRAVAYYTELLVSRKTFGYALVKASRPNGTRRQGTFLTCLAPSLVVRRFRTKTWQLNPGPLQEM